MVNDQDRALAALCNLRAGTHLCHFYQTPDDLLETLVPYFKAGLEQNQMCIWIASQAIDVDEARQAMARAVPDLQRRIDRGQIEFHPYRDWYIPDGRVDPQRVLQGWVRKQQEMRERGFESLRVTGDTAWCGQEDWRTFMSYEEYVARELGNYPIAAVCTYDLERCRAAELMDAARTHELVLVRRDGQWDLLESSPLRHAREQLRDSHAKLQALAHQLCEAERGERRRIANYLHDSVQQTLAAAQMSLAQLREQYPPAAEHADHVRQLVRDSITQCRSLTSQISPPLLYEAGLCAALKWLATWFKDNQRLHVELDLPAAEPRLEEATRAFLFETGRELLFNAAKHAATDRAALAVRLNAGQVELSIRDDGRGFDTSAGEGAPSNGDQFGLFSIRQRIGVMGGQFHVDSAPGRGCRVWLTLPASSATVDEPRPVAVGGPPVSAAAAKISSNGNGHIRVLLVDDHRILREGIALLLGSSPKVEVIGQASDGLEAVEMARRLRPDVVVMDISMPGMDGIEATRRALREQPHIRVIGLSMHEQPHMSQSMLLAGAQLYLRKDGPAEELLAAVTAGARPQPHESLCLATRHAG